MPGTTDIGLPYPLGSEPFADGADAIQALAEALSAPYAEGIGSSTSIPTGGTGTTVQYTTTAMSSQFSYSAGVFTYTGPDRRFLIVYEGRWDYSGTPTEFEARLVVNNNIVLDDLRAYSTNQEWNHFTRILKLQSGDTIKVVLRQDSGFAASLGTLVGEPSPTFTILGQLR